ncbi:hypothetical protein PR048_016662 [Dryococelus australis]|uniref:Uncharacterized protein n=1 Tax=Dryococelus australis TaxID=614101 RepID=A0ABQ9H7E6_9NEOP|nr:hypothetical protein PR048_016662 [Dryococelus australis]
MEIQNPVKQRKREEQKYRMCTFLYAKHSCRGIVGKDMRGSHVPHHKLSDESLEKAKAHLLSLPAYESLYTRRDSEKNYLPSHYTLSKKKIGHEVEQHHINADNAYKAKADREKSKDYPKCKTIIFDVQQCLLTPHFHSSMAFNKHQLWVNNLTVHDCDHGQGFSYTWDESVAVRGGNEIASCLYRCFSTYP